MIPRIIRNYVWVPSGEAVRGLEVAVASEIVQVIYRTDLAAVTNPKTWALSVGLAAMTAAVAYIKGKLPPAPPGSTG